jgi:hypothetical protein
MRMSLSTHNIYFLRYSRASDSQPGSRNQQTTNAGADQGLPLTRSNRIIRLRNRGRERSSESAPASIPTRTPLRRPALINRPQEQARRRNLVLSALVVTCFNMSTVKLSVVCEITSSTDARSVQVRPSAACVGCAHEYARSRTFIPPSQRLARLSRSPSNLISTSASCSLRPSCHTSLTSRRPKTATRRLKAKMEPTGMLHLRAPAPLVILW